MGSSIVSFVTVAEETADDRSNWEVHHCPMIQKNSDEEMTKTRFHPGSAFDEIIKDKTQGLGTSACNRKCATKSGAEHLTLAKKNELLRLV